MGERKGGGTGEKKGGDWRLEDPTNVSLCLSITAKKQERGVIPCFEG